MSERFRLFKNLARGGAYYLQDNLTGKQKSLRTQDRDTAYRLLHANNEAARQPAVNRQITHAYLLVPEPNPAGIRERRSGPARYWAVFDTCRVGDRRSGDTVRSGCVHPPAPNAAAPT